MLRIKRDPSGVKKRDACITSTVCAENYLLNMVIPKLIMVTMFVGMTVRRRYKAC